jgi:hypothetical protein
MTDQGIGHLTILLVCRVISSLFVRDAHFIANTELNSEQQNIQGGKMRLPYSR